MGKNIKGHGFYLPLIDFTKLNLAFFFFPDCKTDQ